MHLNKNAREGLKVAKDILFSPHELDKKHFQVLDDHPDHLALPYYNFCGLFYVSQRGEI